MGYCGGTSESPTYHNIGDHAETIQIDFDADKTSYGALLAAFWKNHNPCGRPWSTQYMSAVFYHDDEQKRLTTVTMQQEEARRGSKIHTAITAAGPFTLAEDYHQKYYLRQEETLFSEYSAIYPELKDFVHSSAVTRVNGYVGGNGSGEDLDREMTGLGLSDKGQARLRNYVKEVTEETGGR